LVDSVPEPPWFLVRCWPGHRVWIDDRSDATLGATLAMRAGVLIGGML
jgi:hypothetical protein